MNYRLFQYVLRTSAELEDLNHFLSSHRVSTVTHHLVPTAGGALLVFEVGTVGAGAAASLGSGPKVSVKTESASG